MENQVDYNEVIQFMGDFRIDFINSYRELIIDEETNIYTSTSGCKDMEDVKMLVVFALCRPIAKGLPRGKAELWLKRLNKYFNVSLTREDMLLMYQKLCYRSKLEEFKEFIRKGFPIEELRREGE